MQNRCRFLLAYPWRNLVLFHVCCLPGSWGYPISHSNTGNRKSWKADFCGFLFCPMPEPVTWMRLLVALSFLFNNYFIYHLQKPVFFPCCNLLIRFPPHHWSPIVPRGWVIQETRKFGLHSYSCWHSKPLHPSPHSSALQQGETLQPVPLPERWDRLNSYVLSPPAQFTSFRSVVGKRNLLGEKLKFCQANTTLLCWLIPTVTLNLTAANHSMEVPSPLVLQSGLGCFHREKGSAVYVVSDTPSSEDFTVILEFHLTTWCIALGSDVVSAPFMWVSQQQQQGVRAALSNF